MDIKTAVFPVAGFGTRMLPATKAIPKEMITLIDKPLIQYAVEEAINAGIERIIFITGRTKKALEDHFDINIELNQQLASAGKMELSEAKREGEKEEKEKDGLWRIGFFPLFCLFVLTAWLVGFSSVLGTGTGFLSLCDMHF